MVHGHKFANHPNFSPSKISRYTVIDIVLTSIIMYVPYDHNT